MTQALTTGPFIYISKRNVAEKRQDLINIDDNSLNLPVSFCVNISDVTSLRKAAYLEIEDSELSHTNTCPSGCSKNNMSLVASYL